MSIAEFRKCSLRPTQDIGGKRVPQVENEQAIRKVRVWHDEEWVTGLEIEWATGEIVHHGDATGEVTEVPLSEGEYIISVGIKCSNGERNTHISCIRFSTSAGARTKWIGGRSGTTRILKTEGHRVIGFAGRASHYIDALGVLTSPLPTESTSLVAPVRGPVYGGPSGINFSDFSTTDCSQLTPIILRSAFESTSLDSKKQRMLESSRQLFTRLKQVISTHPHATAEVYSRFEKQFGVTLSEVDQDDSFPVSPLISSTVKRLNSPSRVDLQPFSLNFDIFTPHFIFNATGSSASCQISAGWRSVSCSGALTLTEDTALEVNLLIEEVRTLAYGVSPDAVNELQSFIGGTPNSVAFQSSGHVVNDSSLIEESKPFGKGDTVSLLITTDTITSYVNGHRGTTTTTPKSKTLFVTVSCHLGPNSFTLLPAYVWKEDKVKGSQFPPETLF